MPGEFTHKGVTITITTAGGFQYRDKSGKLVTKTSLKAAQNAIDKEVGAVVVVAMNGIGDRVEITGKHRTQGYIDTRGLRVGNYGRLYPWNEEAAAKLRANSAAQTAERKRRDEALDKLRKDRQHVLNGLGEFDYDAAVRAKLSEPKTPAE